MNADEKRKRLARLQESITNSASIKPSNGIEIRESQDVAAVSDEFRKIPVVDQGNHINTDKGLFASSRRRPVDTSAPEISAQTKKQKLDSLNRRVIVIDDDDDDTIDLTDGNTDKEVALEHVIKSSLTQCFHQKSLKFEKGEVRLTTSERHPKKTLFHISIEELLDRSNLEQAVLSAFQVDLEWLAGKLDIGRTDVWLVCEAKNQEARIRWEDGCKLLPKVRPILPPMEHANCMHSKLQLLFFKDFLRIVIPSANLVPYDWGEGGLMENVLYVQDLQALERNETSCTSHENENKKAQGVTAFERDLTYFLTRANYPVDLIRAVRNYDFKHTHGIRLVTTIGGESHGHSEIERTGLQSLSNAVKSLTKTHATPSDPQISYITASIGALKTDFVNNFVRACQGRSLHYQPFTKSKDPKTSQDNSSSNLKIIFPTREEVLRSNAGSAGTICFQRSYYNHPEFPKSAMYQHLPIRRNLLSHCKMILCNFGADSPGQDVGWSYVGSANFSASAWGDRIVTDKKTKGERMTCRNWECGVIFPLQKVRGLVPVKDMRRANRDPWFFMES